MHIPPKYLDGAKVLTFTTSRITKQENFGLVNSTEGDDIEIKGLALCKYDDEGYYVFACDNKWKVVGDLYFDEFDDAKINAEEYYAVKAIRWAEVDNIK